MPDVSIFRTAKLWEIDMARDALKRANVPHYVREELSGIETAFQAAPAAGPGVTFTFHVPHSAVKKAKRLLKGLHLDLHQQPGYWDFADPAVVRGYKTGAKVTMWGIIIAIVIVIVRAIVLFFNSNS